jgi:hypothetical protein
MGHLLSTLTLWSGWLWVIAVACVIAGHFVAQGSRRTVQRLAFLMIALASLGIAVWRAYSQFALDTFR